MLASLLVKDGLGHAHGRHLAFEEAFLLGAGSALLAEERVLVLGLPADFVAFGNHFSSVAHDHIKARHFFLEHRIGTTVAWYHADTFDTATDGRIDSFILDLVRCERDGLQAGRAKTIDRSTRDCGRQPGQHGGNARNVVSLGTVRLRASQDYIFNLVGIEFGRLAQRVLDAMGGKFVRASNVE